MEPGTEDKVAPVSDPGAPLLERLVRTPARRLVLAVVFRQIARRMTPTRGGELDSSVLWRVTGRADGATDDYRLELADGRCRVRRGASADGDRPALTITLSATELLRLITRRSDPVAAYFTGRVTITGNAMVAAKLGALFLAPAQRTSG